MSKGRKPLSGANYSDTMVRIIHGFTKLNPNQRDDNELIGYIVKAMDAALELERARIINGLPGGNVVDPQWVADMVRWGDT